MPFPKRLPPPTLSDPTASSRHEVIDVCDFYWVWQEPLDASELRRRLRWQLTVSEEPRHFSDGQSVMRMQLSPLRREGWSCFGQWERTDFHRRIQLYERRAAEDLPSEKLEKNLAMTRVMLWREAEMLKLGAEEWASLIADIAASFPSIGILYAYPESDIGEILKKKRRRITRSQITPYTLLHWTAETVLEISEA